MVREIEEYKRSYHEGDKIIERYRKFRQIVPRNASQIATDILIDDINYHPKILDIGGGTGEAIIHIARELLREQNHCAFSIDYIDVSARQTSIFLENMHNEGLDKHIRKTKLSAWESFQPQDKYNIILAIHSWYGIDNWQEDIPDNALRKVKDYLEPNGKAYITIEQKGSLFNKVIEAVKGNATTGDDISDALKRLEIKHEKQSISDGLYFIYNLLKNGQLTQAGKDTISYLLDMDFEDLPAEKQAEITEIVKQQRANPNYAASDLIIIPGEQK